MRLAFTIFLAAVGTGEAAPRMIACGLQRNTNVYEVLAFDSTSPTAAVVAMGDLDDLAPTSLVGNAATVYGFNSYPGGSAFYVVNIQNGSSTELGRPGFEFWALDLGCDGELYAIDGAARLYAISRTSAAAQLLFDFGDWQITSDMACGSGPGPRGRFFVGADAAGMLGDQLLRVDIDTQSVEMVGTNTLPRTIAGLDCTRDGRIFGVTADAKIFQVDPATGICTTPVAIAMAENFGCEGMTIIDDCGHVAVQKSTWSIMKQLYNN